MRILESAAVLCKSWAEARRAAEWLRRCGHRAELAGERALLQTRTAADLRLWLRWLLDPTDDVVAVGVLKHPSVGVSDGGLGALVRHGRLAPILAPDCDLSGLDDADRAALEQALPALREARMALGREATAAVLERLVADLHWRPILMASSARWNSISPK